MDGDGVIVSSEQLDPVEGHDAAVDFITAGLGNIPRVGEGYFQRLGMSCD